MNYFRDMKLTTKLISVLILVLVGFAIIGAMDFKLVTVQNKLSTDTEKLHKFVTAANKTQNSFLISTAALSKALLEEQREDNAEQYDAQVRRFRFSMNDANTGTAELEKLASNDRQEQVIYQLRDAMSAYQRSAVTLTNAIANSKETSSNYQITTDLDKVKKRELFVEPLIDSLVKLTDLAIEENEKNSKETLSIFNIVFLSVIIGVAVLVLISVLMLAAGVRRSLSALNSAIGKISEGQYDARVNLESKDELGLLGDTLDELLDERFEGLEKIEQENTKLNDSIVELLEGVSELSDRNLTIKLPVNEDVTGPLADAINMMSSETASVLLDIRDVSTMVENVSSQVRVRSNRVNELASNERVIVENTMMQLTDASASMAEVAQLAKDCNDTAAKASASTQQALDTVNKTVTGMGVIRETIAETEKRIKRLGERSQEINGVVQIINNIAERTQVLALNASMQAAAAGDAGRGFAVVADEVQRLAESSRQSTSEIAALVSNIQTETAETMATMNKSITQVVDGTELTQAAGGQMQKTQKTTSELVKAVEDIFNRSIAQAKVTEELRKQAGKVQQSTQETSDELVQQASETRELVEFTSRMVESVNVFELPKA